MKRFGIFAAACAFVCTTAVAGIAADGTTSGTGDDAAQVQALKGRITGDPDILSLVMSLQDDPEMQALLQDKQVLDAVQSGNYRTLMENPHIQKLMQNSRVKEIGKRLQGQSNQVGE